MGAVTTDLPNGDHIVFRDPAQVKERDRRKVKAALFGLDPATLKNLETAEAEGRDPSVDDFTQADLENLDSINDVSIVALIQVWARPEGVIDGEATDMVDVPITVDSLLDLEGADYDKLNEVAGPIVEALSLSFEPTKPGEDSPTATASA